MNGVEESGLRSDAIVNRAHGFKVVFYDGGLFMHSEVRCNV